MVSVVTSSRDGAARLRLALESLCSQTCPRADLEVVVVDDGAGEDARDVVRDFEARLPLRWSRQRQAGVASARNHGLFLARGVIVLFLDDDAADPQLLDRHLEVHRRFPEPRFAVIGRAELSPSIVDDPVMSFVHGTAAPGAPAPAAGEPLGWRHFQAGRSSCKRKFLLESGTFSSAFRWVGEGAELGYRLSRRGFQVVYEPRAATRVARALAVDDLCLRAYREGRAGAMLARLHPTKEIEGWTGAAGAREAWRELAQTYDAIVHSARELDRIARLSARHRLEVDGAVRALLRRSYWAAFDASRVKGLADGAGEGVTAAA